MEVTYLFSFLAVLMSACEVTGWNLDNFVMFSPIALWLVFPAFVLIVGLLGGRNFYRRSRTAKANSTWYVQRHMEPEKWRFRLCVSVIVAVLFGGGGGAYVLGWMSMLLPSKLDIQLATIISRGVNSSRPPPICREFRQLRSTDLGKFSVCISKPRGRKIVVESQTSLHVGAVVKLTTRRSVLGTWVVSIGPNV